MLNSLCITQAFRGMIQSFENEGEKLFPYFGCPKLQNNAFILYLIFKTQLLLNKFHLNYYQLSLLSLCINN